MNVVSKVRGSNGFMRTVASIVLVAFTTVTISPSVQAMQQMQGQRQLREQWISQERSSLANALGRGRESLRILADRHDSLARQFTREDKRAAREALRAWREQTRGLMNQMRSEFASTGELLARKSLPEEIRQRHARAVATFDAEVAALNADVDGALAATDPQVEKDRAESAYRRLQRSQSGRSQQLFDPNSLPNMGLQPDRSRTPKTTSEAFQAALLSQDPTIRLAQAAGFDFSQLPGASDAAYLQANTEVVLTPDIQSKAQELNRSPIEIYNWVRNNVQWQPSWGAIQDASHTLSSRRGNAFDIASLTIALLRASGIPARYVHGTIDVPEDRFRNWAGGFQNVDAAMDFASAGGIPIAAVVSGGRVTKVRLEHVWVEAAIDFNPSRGAKNRSADSWVAMDASFKQLDVLSGIDVVQVSGVDPDAVGEAVSASGTINQAEGWATGFDAGILQSAHAQASASVESYIQQRPGATTAGDIIGGRRIVAQDAPVLAASLPNRVVVAGARFAAVPASLQQRITFAFGKDIEGEPVDPRTFPWAMLNSRQVTLSFRPAAQADQDALRALLPAGEITDLSQIPTSVPAYLIRVVPELKVDGALIMSGSSMQLGNDLDFVFTPSFVGAGPKPFSYKVPAGSYLAVAVVAGSSNPAQLAATRARLQSTRTIFASNDPAQINSLNQERLLGDLFQSGVLGYYTQYVGLGEMTGRATRGHHQLAAGLGSYGYEPNVETFFGIPRRVERGSVAMNIPIVNVVATDNPLGAGSRDFTMQLGMLSSALEHVIPEQMFTSATNPGEAVSAVKALSKANAAGQRIYQITRANQATALPMIAHDTATMSEIQAALAVGKTVITHTSAISVPGWSGAGYVIMDPDTGAAAWKISGGLNGGNYSAEAVALLCIAALALWGTGGAFTLTIVGAIAAALVLASIVIGLALLVHEYMEDPSQLVEERYQIYAIIALALAPLAAVLTGTAAGPGLAADAVATTVGQQLWALVFQLFGTVLTLLGLV